MDPFGDWCNAQIGEGTAIMFGNIQESSFFYLVFFKKKGVKLESCDEKKIKVL